MGMPGCVCACVCAQRVSVHSVCVHSVFARMCVCESVSEFSINKYIEYFE